MKAMLLAFAAMAVISVGASYTLHEMGFSAQERTSGEAVRID
jgi:sensor domain CHASE-containing protein